MQREFDVFSMQLQQLMGKPVAAALTMCNGMALAFAMRCRSALGFAPLATATAVMESLFSFKQLGQMLRGHLRSMPAAAFHAMQQVPDSFQHLLQLVPSDVRQFCSGLIEDHKLMSANVVQTARRAVQRVVEQRSLSAPLGQGAAGAATPAAPAAVPDPQLAPLQPTPTTAVLAVGPPTVDAKGVMERALANARHYTQRTGKRISWAASIIVAWCKRKARPYLNEALTQGMAVKNVMPDMQQCLADSGVLLRASRAERRHRAEMAHGVGDTHWMRMLRPGGKIDFAIDNIDFIQQVGSRARLSGESRDSSHLLFTVGIQTQPVGEPSPAHSQFLQQQCSTQPVTSANDLNIGMANAGQLVRNCMAQLHTTAS